MEYHLRKNLEATLAEKAEGSDMGFKHSALIFKGRVLYGTANNMSCDGPEHSIHAECGVMEKLKGKGASKGLQYRDCSKKKWHF
mgnify:CR=1 FL=1